MTHSTRQITAEFSVPAPVIGAAEHRTASGGERR